MEEDLSPSFVGHWALIACREEFCQADWQPLRCVSDDTTLVRMSKANQERRRGNSSVRVTEIKGDEEKEKMAMESIMLRNTPMEVPRGSGPGEGCKIEKTPLSTRPPRQLRAGINEGR
ncbi:hypothetical protein EYF80_029005 [Liparis tanakae]|uniref:Uncharacterized protein n=1 Tax=Liparis tanakae TaxID=230148 RepID=A0A4Z2H559_9TELE|nr:hypothetical protein EYF80_029005 [Liparis tanakae]